MNEDTVITEISVIQVKLFYLHFKSVKINEDLNNISEIPFTNLKSPEAIKKRGETIYYIADIITLFEGYHSFVNNIYNYKNISRYLTQDLKTKLGNIQKVTVKWKHVRNKIGGHVDIDVIQQFCESYNYKGVFISDNPEADFKGVLLPQMIESAINSTLDKSKLFEKKININEQTDLNKLIKKIHDDWGLCLYMFKYIYPFLYEIGKEDKLKTITKDDIGLIKF